jgi:hypothetical protein
MRANLNQSTACGLWQIVQSHCTTASEIKAPKGFPRRLAIKSIFADR